jgi:hypothetical protein
MPITEDRLPKTEEGPPEEPSSEEEELPITEEGPPEEQSTEEEHWLPITEEGLLTERLRPIETKL